MRSIVAIIAHPASHVASLLAGEPYLTFSLERISFIRKYGVALWPERDVEHRRTRNVRKLGPGWFEVSGPIALAPGKRFEAAVCWCVGCGGSMRVISVIARGTKAENFSAMWIKTKDAT